MVEQKNTVKVFVVSNSAHLRRNLQNMFEHIPVVELVGEAEEPQSALRALSDLSAVHPDVILLNLDPRRNGGLDLFDYVTHRHPRCKTIVLSKPAEAKSIRHFLEKRIERSAGENGIDTFIDPNDPARIRACIEKSVTDRTEMDSQHPTLYPDRAHPDGTIKYLYDYVGYVSTGQPERDYSGIVSGINERRRQRTGRRQSEIALMESADRFQSLVEQLPGMPYIANLDKVGSNVYVSPKIEGLLGFTAEQWCKEPQLRIRQLHPDDREYVLKAINDATANGSSFSIDYRIYRHDGTLRWFHDEARVVVGAQGEPLFLQGAVLDVTERKQAQAELEQSHQELQDLIAALDSLRVEEQKRLAHEMHDDFGQMLAAMKMDLSTLQQHLPQSDARIVRQLSSINELVDAMVVSVRRIIADLPPKVLEDVGLYSALEFITANFEKRHRIACRLHLSDPEPILEAKVATAIYRVVQETLNNVAKHAHANYVEARVICSGADINLCVKDNGRGMAPDKLQKPGSFGLIGMRQRVTALGGEINIDSAEGAGTAIKITIPIKARGMRR
jgi:two-component system sensor histidine kinase UhpB